MTGNRATTSWRAHLNVNRFSGVKVFSATTPPDRERLGQRISDWLSQNSRLRIVDKVVLQSSDSAFHCLSVTLFFSEGDRG